MSPTVACLGAILLAAAASGVVVAAEGQGSGFDAHAVFAEANRRFELASDVEDLEAAARGYEELLAHGLRNANIYYNLGNTYLRLREPGHAILNFRRALLFDPAHAHAEAMLARARDSVTDRFVVAEEQSIWSILFFWHETYHISARVWCLAVTLALFWGLLGLRLYARIPLYRFFVALLFVSSLALAVSVMVETVGERGRSGVVVGGGTAVRTANRADSSLVFEQPVQSGVEVRIIDTRGPWRQVEFPDGAIGWVAHNTVAAIDEVTG